MAGKLILLTSIKFRRRKDRHRFSSPSNSSAHGMPHLGDKTWRILRHATIVDGSHLALHEGISLKQTQCV